MGIAKLFCQVEGGTHSRPGILYTSAIQIEPCQFQCDHHKLTGAQTIVIQIGRLLERFNCLRPLAHSVQEPSFMLACSRETWSVKTGTKHRNGVYSQHRERLCQVPLLAQES